MRPVVHSVLPTDVHDYVLWLKLLKTHRTPDKHHHPLKLVLPWWLLKFTAVDIRLVTQLTTQGNTFIFVKRDRFSDLT